MMDIHGSFNQFLTISSLLPTPLLSFNFLRSKILRTPNASFLPSTFCSPHQLPFRPFPTRNQLAFVLPHTLYPAGSLIPA
mmetsp:Transcript_28637/g.5187  ORF Transcript_28637/g.5187 Transcript_28637/m.5187 type:complete len:80 (-) Transcript_28637:69-308(-)